MVKLGTGALGAASVFLVMLSMMQPAYGYIDPGTGSLLLQMVIGGVAGAFVVVKLFWKGLVARLGLGGGSETAPDNDDRA